VVLLFIKESWCSVNPRYFSTPAVNRDWQSDNMGTGTNKRKVLSVQQQFNVIRATENGKREC